MTSAHEAIMAVNPDQKPDARLRNPAYATLCDNLDDLANYHRLHREELAATRNKMFPLAVEAVTIYDTI